MGDAIFMICFAAFFAVPFVTYLGLVATGAVQLPAGKQGGAGRRLLGPMIIGYYYWLLGPLFRFVNGTKLTPNQVTIASLGAALLTAMAIATGHFSLAACLLIGGATLDIVDGQLARAKKLSTPSGAFLDSTLDRISDGLIFGGCVVYYAGTPMMYVSLVVMIMSFTVSYARARGETLGVSGAEGLMQRADRITILGVALAFSALIGHRTEGFVAHPFYGVTAGALCIMAVLNTFTVISRIRFTMQRLDENAAKGATTTAQPAHLNIVRPARVEIRRPAVANDAAPLLNQQAR
jgi:CDP-diacylglycerol--glycerol-3-phosphate 3-phosphatidyltransferase